MTRAMISATGIDAIRKRQRHAFTLIELLIVALILGVLVGISIPRLKKNFDEFRLQSFAGNLQSFMNYLRDRSIVEQKVIYLEINKDGSERYWAETRIGTVTTIFKSYRIPEDLSIEITKMTGAHEEITPGPVLFYPDGNIDKVRIKIANPGKESFTLTTIGVFGAVKIESEK